MKCRNCRSIYLVLLTILCSCESRTSIRIVNNSAFKAEIRLFPYDSIFDYPISEYTHNYRYLLTGYDKPVQYIDDSPEKYYLFYIDPKDEVILYSLLNVGFIRNYPDDGIADKIEIRYGGDSIIAVKDSVARLFGKLESGGFRQTYSLIIR